MLYGDVLSVGGVRSMGADRADYSNSSGPINVQLAAGTVTGQGNDTLDSIEFVRGSAFDDVYNAVGFSATSTNGGGAGYTFTTGIGALGSTNEFEGMDGNDSITGNGATRTSYLLALAGVYVDLQSGTAYGHTGVAPGTTQDMTDAAGVGQDTLGAGIVQVRGSAFNDYIKGRNDNGNNDRDVRRCRWQRLHRWQRRL